MSNRNLKNPLLIWRFVDGKAGHERQTEGLAQALGEMCRVEVVEIDVSRKRAATWEHLRRLRAEGMQPALLMGAGRRSHWPLIWARWLTGAPTVVLMRPSLPRWLFNFCLLPEHDGVRPRKNDLVIQGVLNAVQESSRQDADRGLILVGGPCRHVDWDSRELLRQLEGIIKKAPGMTWMLTSSRRTPPDLVAELARSSWPRVTFVPYQDTPPGWVSEALQRAGQTWVSPDSVTMVFEALTSGSQVGVFELVWHPGSKLKRSIDRLVADRLVTPYSAFESTGKLEAPSRVLNESRRSARWLLERIAWSLAPPEDQSSMETAAHSGS